MKVFNIEEYKKNPDRKLVIEHYDMSKPEQWTVSDVQIIMNERLAIRIPHTGYDTEEIVLVDESGEIRDVDSNLVGVLVFERSQMTMEEFITLIETLETGEKLNFTCDEKGGTEWGIAKIKLFDAELIIMAIYGSGDFYLYDDAGNKDISELKLFVDDVLMEHFINFVYVESVENIEENHE